jgi:hypothetical protein
MSAGTDRKVVFALLAIAALCLIGLGASLYRAKSGELRVLHRELTSKQNQLEVVRKKLTKQPELEAKYARLQARLAVLEPTLPDSAYMPTFLRQIEHLAVATENRIVGIRPKASTAAGKSSPVRVNDETGEVLKEGAEKASGQASANAEKSGQGKDKPKVPYDYSSIELKIEGTYSTVIGFLRELERFPKMIAVNDIGFSPKSGKEADQSPELTATMELTAVVAKGGKHVASQ